MDGIELSSSSNGDFPWHLGVYDAHCHPTDTVSSYGKIPQMKARALTAMATRTQDQNLVSELADRFPPPPNASSESERDCFVIPAFGWHPWFSHQIYDDTTAPASQRSGPPSKAEHYRKVIVPSPEDDPEFIDFLPTPLPLSGLLRQFRENLERHPLALVGEFGLDRAFRIPKSEFACPDCVEHPLSTPGGREGRGLTQYRVQMDHQRAIATAQLNLAGEYQRAVSVHGVAAHGVLFETLRACWRGHENKLISNRSRKREASLKDTSGFGDLEGPEQADMWPDRPLPFPPRVCLHSYSGSVENLRLYLHPSVPTVMYFSFSKLVNFSYGSEKVVAVIQAIPDDRILIESDLYIAGDRLDELLEDIVRTVCLLKCWSLSGGIQQLALNWKRFIYGNNIDSETELHE